MVSFDFIVYNIFSNACMIIFLFQNLKTPTCEMEKKNSHHMYLLVYNNNNRTKENIPPYRAKKSIFGLIHQKSNRKKSMGQNVTKKVREAKKNRIT